MIPLTVEKALHSIHTKTYHSEVPESIKSSNSPVILGVDEAGRGPVVGPMVYGIAYCTRDFQEQVLIPDYDFDDSKKLTDEVRRKLFRLIYEDRQINDVGYATTCISPCDISNGMFRFPPSKNYNLNEQAHDVTMDLIQGVINQGVTIEHVYVDTVGPPNTYQKKLETRFPGIKFTVAKKADSLYCVVSVASVVAKVTRDLLVEALEEDSTINIRDHTTGEQCPVGSGYPSDPRTKVWLRQQQTPLFGWPLEMVRFSWQTCQTLLDDNAKTGKGVEIQWEEDFINSKKNLEQAWKTYTSQDTNSPITLDNWYH
ncbi:hypothetical protein KAFR_0J00850 [Kazachstania africana CBS 2517]|uniref:Ribonuclease n=1 Tax=Kazachstania africana (strain ATCC 22294 / BCRC 22015 / CBS 2517 / CECT 1963 / NBRC 1671 / NRRL Y-8276) TaxID=1071382 RepID=H2B0K3_KAZAF|nr:hypothetical protein KAFR_0J00850 [Kazachstania africana CBS 2517]CCF60153.1 hypothetical protein KAFR_0J00850 [Kazachstania africana CBS 2517]